MTRILGSGQWCWLALTLGAQSGRGGSWFTRILGDGQGCWSAMTLGVQSDGGGF